MKRARFYYDFACPYAYLAHTQIEAVCARSAGVELVYEPFLLGGVFRALGVADTPEMPEAKARMNALDMHRWAAHWGVPLVMPEGHPNRTVLALRAALASNDLPRASKALFRAYWAEGRDVSQRDVVRAALDGAGFEGRALVARASDDDIKEALRARTDGALAAGVFGAPTFVVTVGDRAPELFWGQDRLGFVARALGTPPHTPSSSAAPQSAPRAPASGYVHGGRDLLFFYDLSSPFAYLASTQIERVAARCGARLTWKPFLLGGLFRAIGTPDVPLFAMPEPKQRHARADMHRWAAHYDVPFRFPSRFPMRTVKALRLILALPEPKRPALVHALFSAYWALDRDIADESVLAAVADAIGLDGRALVSASESEPVKDALRTATDEAVRAGVCGAPSFLVDGELFWGQDRLELVEERLWKGQA